VFYEQFTEVTPQFSGIAFQKELQVTKYMYNVNEDRFNFCRIL